MTFYAKRCEERNARINSSLMRSTVAFPFVKKDTARLNGITSGFEL